MKRFDVLVIGELNADLILNDIQNFPIVGKEVIANKLNITLGSSSAIFASNLSVLGARVAFAGSIGADFFGDFILDCLHKKNVDTSFVRNLPTNTGITVALNYGEERAMVTYPGAMDQFSINDLPDNVFESASHLHVSSYFLQRALKPNLVRLFTLAKKAGLTTSFDTQWDPAETWDLDINSILPLTDIFLPNERELLNITKAHQQSDAIKKIKPFSNTIVVKQGSLGSSLYHNGEHTFKQAFVNHNVVDAIGAGDSFNAGFIYKYIKKAPLIECQEFGNLIGAISTTASGGTSAFSSRAEIERIAIENFAYNKNGFTN